MTAEIVYISALDAIRKFRARALSPVELMQAIVERAEQVEPVVNALCLTEFESALDQARTAETRYRDGTARPLEGIPLAIKDAAGIAGKVTTNGSLLLKNYIAAATDPVPQRLLDAGAIMHARTTTPEFSMEFFTWSRQWGVTRNPWNPAITPGGSSGGSGASLASGTSILATGSDIGGSIRVPAALNGIVGFKPPYGRVPQTSPWNLDTYCHEGPMARTVRDCILMQNIIAGPHPADMTTLRPKLVLPTVYDGLRGLRIGYTSDLGFFDVHAEGCANLRAAAEKLSQLGAVIEPVELNWDERCRQTADTHYRHLSGAILLRDFGRPDQRDQLTSYIRKFLDISQSVTAEDIIAAREYANEMYLELSRVFEVCDALICPTMATTDIPADYKRTRKEGGTSDESFSMSKGLDLFLTYPFNILSRCPVLNVPTGRADNGVPTGMQIVARPYDDETTFRIGIAWEDATGLFWDSGDYPQL